MKYVLDASVAAKWFLSEAGSEHATRLVLTAEKLHAPDFLLLEMDAILWKKIRRSEMTWDEAEKARATLRDSPLQFHPFADLLEGAFRLAVATERTVYDCLYLSLALKLNVQLVTADRKFYQALATRQDQSVLWFEDVPEI